MLVRFINGALKQKQRDKTLKDFKQGDFNILCATDLAARGLDIDDISLVINYELPLHPQEYIHRIGRTGRFNKEGRSITLLAKADKTLWKEIKNYLNTNEKSNSKNIDLEETFKQIKQSAAPVEKQIKKESKPTTTITKIKPKKLSLPKIEQKNKTTVQENNFWGFKKVYVGKPAKEKPIRKTKQNKFSGKKTLKKSHKR